jgi:ferrous iron transport protein B
MAILITSTADSTTDSQQTHACVGFTVALAGNPNCGKSTIFNALTGSHQHVGNWPGKTIEKHEGVCAVPCPDGPSGASALLDVIDLPGTYSLSAFSAEEVIAQNYLLDETPDLVVAVVDASNLERNLYLLVQVLEMGLPVLLALNMIDTAEARGLRIDCERLSAGLLAVPVVPMAARSGRGIDDLRAMLGRLSGEQVSGARPSRLVDYGREIEQEIARLESAIRAESAFSARFQPRWLAIKLLEGDESTGARLSALPGGPSLLEAAREAATRIQRANNEDPAILLADRRYGYINGLVREVVQRPPLDRRTRSDQLDQVLTHPLGGIPVFVAAMVLVFQMTANVSSHYVDWLDAVISGPISRWLAALLGLIGLGGSWVESLVMDGIIAGVGGVLAFIPVLAFMYFFIAVLEDSGYMARAAFLMDRVMHAVGLHGKSFIPMLLGFGCSVPGILATRTLEDRRDRILTGLLVPFMSCGARLPVYLVFGVAFFGAHAGLLVFAMYGMGVVVALLAGLLLRRTVFRDKDEAPFVIELPPYRLPSLRGVLRHTWERTWLFIRNAATVILLASVAIWLLLAIPAGGDGEVSFAQAAPGSSALSAVSGWIAPVLRPAGIDTWQAASALVTGVVAKEVVISTLSVLYLGDAPPLPAPAPAPRFWQDLGQVLVSFLDATWDTLRATISILPGVNLLGAEEAAADAALLSALRTAFSPLSAVAFCVFVLLMTPCISTLTAIRREFGWPWMVFSVTFSLALAWLLATLTYQGGRLLGLG